MKIGQNFVRQLSSSMSITHCQKVVLLIRTSRKALLELTAGLFGLAILVQIPSFLAKLRARINCPRLLCSLCLESVKHPKGRNSV